MDEKERRKLRIDQLKKKIKNIENNELLFEECISALGRGVKIFSELKSQNIIDELVKKFPFTKWGRIDWDLVPYKKPIKKLTELRDCEISNEDLFYVVWSHSSPPVIETSLDQILKCWDDVVAVSSDTWMINKGRGNVS